MSPHPSSPTTSALPFSRAARHMVPSETRALFSMAARPDVVSLAGGMPCPDALPAQDLGAALDAVLSGRAATALQYGSAQGDPALREQICRFTAAEGVSAVPEDVLVTVGSQQALDLVTRVLVDPGDTVVTEGPTYVTALGTFAAHRARVVHTAMDHDGVIPETLEETFALLAAEGRPAKLFYTVPTFHNPTGTVLCAERRRQVLEVCRRAGVLVLEDNPYGMLHFEDRPMRALRADDPDNVVYLGSFSKVLAPGLRVGWALAPRPILEKLVLAAESAMLSHSNLAQLTVEHYLTTRPWQENLRSARSAYRERRDAMLLALTRLMPPGISWTVPQGGFFVWMTLPEAMNTKELLPVAVESGVAFVPGTGFRLPGGGTRNLRLSYSYPSPPEIEEGVRRLADVLREALPLSDRYWDVLSGGWTEDPVTVGGDSGGTSPV